MPHVPVLCELLQSGMWPQQSTWVMFPLPVAVPDAPPQQLMVMYQVRSTSIVPIIRVWFVSWLAGSEQLRRIMEIPLQNQLQWCFYI